MAEREVVSVPGSLQVQEEEAGRPVPWWKRTPQENGFVKRAKAGEEGVAGAGGSGSGSGSGSGREWCCSAAQMLKHGVALAVVAASVVVVLACIGLGHRAVGASEKASAGAQGGQQMSRPLKTLSRPVVILVSADGFRWGYNFKVPTPNLDRLRENGTEAEAGLIPVYPTLTFPNHYSIATGLYPAWHGIIANSFRDPDPDSSDRFYQGNLDPKWWLGEPIWETCAKAGLPAATYFWPGSEVVKPPWNCPPAFCQQYNGSVPFDQRVDAVLGFLDLPDQDRPAFISLYFEVPDHPGHEVGPDHPEIDAAVGAIDGLMGRLLDGLDARNLTDDVTVILVGDHGMVGNCDSRLIFLEDLEPFDRIPDSWLDSVSPVLAIAPPPGVDVPALFANVSKALRSPRADNAQHLKLYLKEDLPPRLRFSASDRVWPIVGIVDEGYKVLRSRGDGHCCGGAHGYDNALLSMRTVFMASGPRFARGRKVPSFENVQLYNVMAAILNVSAAPNNGTPSFVDSILLPLP